MDGLLASLAGDTSAEARQYDEFGMVDDEDFYGDGHGGYANHNMPPQTQHQHQHNTFLGAPNPLGHASSTSASGQAETATTRPNTDSLFMPTPVNQLAVKLPNADEKKVQNQKITEQLRAKLLAQRQNTPRTQSRPNTPATQTLVDTTVKNKPSQPPKEEHPNTALDRFGMEALLAEGKAAAEAKQKEQTAKNKKPVKSTPKQNVNQVNTPQHLQSKQQAAGPTQTNGNAAAPKEEARARDDGPSPPTLLTDAYYADLPTWLEATGYHDVEYRESILVPFKKRQSLEAQLARVQEEIASLNQAEQVQIHSLRATPTRYATKGFAAPALPAEMPGRDSSQAFNKLAATPTNFKKRPHSPSATSSSKVRREEKGGFRFRGANEAPHDYAPARDRSQSRSHQAVGGSARRFSYSEQRPQSSRGMNERVEEMRDPSLERRQSFYGHGPPSNGSWRDQPFGNREPPRTEINNRSRIGYSAVNMRGDDGYGERAHFARGSRDLKMNRGGIRCFMIKSWNHENVATAMENSLWATQVKNEQLLTEAFHTCRHVVLLFSVNKSMAFQGYALMASPPDPSLPKPPFCAKLHWGTSPAFKLHWLSTTPVQFRHVGHIKNPMNLDEDGKPLAVLVGKDGQEIHEKAGASLVAILDDFEEEEVSGRLHEEEMRGRLLA